jgi:hypothetical protein
MISNQVLGVQTWLVRGHNMVVNALGSTANPFQLDVLRQNMMQQPMGTAFIVLLLDWDDEWNGGTATAAHWTVARRQGGGFDYTDYQLDVDPLNRDGMRRQVQRLNAPFGAPSVTNQPMEAFGDPSQATNRYMALAIAQPAPAQGGGGGGGGSCGCLHCYITTAACSAMGLPDDCQELTALRRYRDAVLLTTERGAAEVAEYYATAPSIVAALDKRDDAAAIYRVLYHQHIRPAAVAAEAGEYQTAYRLFRAGVARAAALAAEETDPG